MRQCSRNGCGAVGAPCARDREFLEALVTYYVPVAQAELLDTRLEPVRVLVVATCQGLGTHRDHCPDLALQALGAVRRAVCNVHQHLPVRRISGFAALHQGGELAYPCAELALKLPVS